METPITLYVTSVAPTLARLPYLMILFPAVAAHASATQ
jgi:hypothetical protein